MREFARFTRRGGGKGGRSGLCIVPQLLMYTTYQATQYHEDFFISYFLPISQGDWETELHTSEP